MDRLGYLLTAAVRIWLTVAVLPEVMRGRHWLPMVMTVEPRAGLYLWRSKARAEIWLAALTHTW